MILTPYRRARPPPFLFVNVRLLLKMKRCNWGSSNELMIKYHDEEWGIPLHNDQKIFEFLILEGFQAGLSWQTIINKRKNFEKAFNKFDPKKIAVYTQKDITRLMNDAGIIRNRLKIFAAIGNAKNFLKIKKEFGTFDKYIWGFVNHKTIRNKNSKLSQINITSKESDNLSIDLKKRGFKFAGSTIIYSHMQATGMVNDHFTHCFRYNQV